jgi:hypothetical protein
MNNFLPLIAYGSAAGSHPGTTEDIIEFAIIFGVAFIVCAYAFLKGRK